MGRKKIEIEYLKDDRKRASTFEKRRIGLFKKASELNRLCGVNVAVIVVNKDSLYKYADLPEKFFKNYLNDRSEKLEENFTNDSLLEFITKKPQKMISNNESISNEQQSVCGEQNDILSEDEEDAPFINELMRNNLLDSYRNLQAEISPIKEQSDICSQVNRSSSTSFNFALNEQDLNNSLQTMYYIPNNNNMVQLTNGNSEVKEGNQSSKTEPRFYRDLISNSHSDCVYSYNLNPLSTSTDVSDSSTNSFWQTYKSQNPESTELHFNSKYDNNKNSLETPIFESNNVLPHFSSNMSESLLDFPEVPRLKKRKLQIDPQNSPYSQ